MRRVLVLDGAVSDRGIRWGLGDADAPAPAGGGLAREGVLPGRDGALLPRLLRDAVRDLGWAPDGVLDPGVLLAVVVGPGSFTGLRATLALGRGLAAGSGARLVGVTAGMAMLPAMARMTRGTAWWVSRARRGRVFIETGYGDAGSVRAAMLDALPHPGTDAVILGGGAAAEVASAFADRGVRVLDAGPAEAPLSMLAAEAWRRRDAAGGTERVSEPLYVDPPEVTTPAAPARPGGAG